MSTKLSTVIVLLLLLCSSTTCLTSHNRVFCDATCLSSSTGALSSGLDGFNLSIVASRSAPSGFSQFGSYNPFSVMYKEYSDAQFLKAEAKAKYDIKLIEAILLPADCVKHYDIAKLNYDQTLIATIINSISTKKPINIKNFQSIVKGKIKSAADKSLYVKNRVSAVMGLRSSVKYLTINATALVDRNVKPVLVFINRKSGGQQGRNLLHSLRRLLHYAQVCDLSVQKPSYYFNLYKDVELGCVLVCGGDGTIGWIMDEQRKFRSFNSTPIGFIPAGTGNDLHLHMLCDEYCGRGKGADVASPEERLLLRAQKNLLQSLLEPAKMITHPAKTLRLYSAAKPSVVMMDRWSMKLLPLPKVEPEGEDEESDEKKRGNIGRMLRALGLMASRKIGQAKVASFLQQIRSKKFKTMNNYFGIGVDGAVSLAFDDMRKQVPGLFFHRLVNKMWYGLIGLRTFLFGRNKDLSKCTRLVCDGEPVVIPAGIRGIIVLNINSYAGGSRLWPFPFKGGLKDSTRMWVSQAMNDGVVEVVGVHGVAHLGQIKAGLAKAVPLAQGRRVEISSFSRVPMQLDGEPWMQSPCAITITAADQVKVIIPE